MVIEQVEGWMMVVVGVRLSRWAVEKGKKVLGNHRQWGDGS